MEGRSTRSAAAFCWFLLAACRAAGVLLLLALLPIPASAASSKADADALLAKGRQAENRG